MIQAQQELLSALAQVLDETAPGHGLTAAFESPKQATHGDLAITAAMPLAKQAKCPPRELAQRLKQISPQGTTEGSLFVPSHELLPVLQ